jgi:hypothetical protein
LLVQRSGTIRSYGELTADAIPACDLQSVDVSMIEAVPPQICIGRLTKEKKGANLGASSLSAILSMFVMTNRQGSVERGKKSGLRQSFELKSGGKEECDQRNKSKQNRQTDMYFLRRVTANCR